MKKGIKIHVYEIDITIITQGNTDYISLTDMTAGFFKGSGLIGKWITNKNTLEYLGIWEKINNSDLNYPEFGVINKVYKYGKTKNNSCSAGFSSGNC